MGIFFNSQMNSNETMEQHVNKLNIIVEELDAIRAKVPPKVKVLIFLMSIPNSYQLLVMSLESYESTKLIWEVVTTRLLNEKFMTL
jgi:predicted metal-dependent TIM-barrel fold hydrolase